jgi:hypothetical protein
MPAPLLSMYNGGARHGAAARFRRRPWRNASGVADVAIKRLKS